MSRGAKITLLILVFSVLIFGLLTAAWFLFKNERASAAESFLDQGDKFLNNDNFSQALIAYKKAALLTPRSYAPYLKQGILAQETIHYQEAIDFINRSINLGPQELENYLVLGELYLLNNDLGNAKSAFQKAKKIAPKNDGVDFLLFETALKENNLDEAEENIKTAEKNNNLSKYIIFDALLESLNDPTKSLEIITDINAETDLNGLTLPDFTDLFQKLAATENITSRELMIYQTFAQIGQADFGIVGLEKITKENPQMRDGWVMLAYSCLLGNQPDKAKTALDRAVELDPVYPATYYLLGKYWETTKNDKEAQKALDKAKELGFDENNPLKS